MEGSEAWTEVGELPVAIIGLRGVSLNNNIFMTGNIIVHKLLVKNPDGEELYIYKILYI